MKRFKLRYGGSYTECMTLLVTVISASPNLQSIGVADLRGTENMGHFHVLLYTTLLFNLFPFGFG